MGIKERNEKNEQERKVPNHDKSRCKLKVVLAEEAAMDDDHRAQTVKFMNNKRQRAMALETQCDKEDQLDIQERIIQLVEERKGHREIVTKINLLNRQISLRSSVANNSIKH